MSKKTTNRKSAGGTAVIPVRMPADMQKQIRTVSDMAGLSDADVMRLAITRGIGAVESMFRDPAQKAA